eukprot:338743_1
MQSNDCKYDGDLCDTETRLLKYTDRLRWVIQQKTDQLNQFIQTENKKCKDIHNQYRLMANELNKCWETKYANLETQNKKLTNRLTLIENEKKTQSEKSCDNQIVGMLKHRILKLEQQRQTAINDNEMLRNKMHKMSEMTTFWQEKYFNQSQCNVNMNNIYNSKINKDISLIQSESKMEKDDNKIEQSQDIFDKTGKTLNEHEISNTTVDEMENKYDYLMIEKDEDDKTEKKLNDHEISDLIDETENKYDYLVTEKDEDDK